MKELLARLADGLSLTEAQTIDAFEQIMSGQADPVQVGAMLGMIQTRGATIEELTGAARVMRAKVDKVVVPEGLTAIDTCGTGGDHTGTFNISTAAALVAAAVGRPHGVCVAKHGNRSVTSKSGSSDVLQALGVKIQVTGETLTRCLDEAGICFCFAPAHHPAMKHVMPVRLALGFRTMFNLLGPMTNPAGASRQVLGVYTAKLAWPLAHVLKNLGAEHAMVVHGKADARHGMDELVAWGDNYVAHLQRGQVRAYEIGPDLFHSQEATDIDSIQVNGPEASAALIQRVLQGARGRARDVVCLNAAAAMVVADQAIDIQDAIEMVDESLERGDALRTLDKLVKITQADPTPTP